MKPPILIAAAAVCLLLAAPTTWSAPVSGSGLDEPPLIQVNINALPPLAGHDESEARAINNRGVVVGLSATEDGSAFRAVYWANPPVRALPLPSPANAARAFAINDRGLIGGDTGVIDAVGRATQWLFNRPQLLPDFQGGKDSTVRALNERGYGVGSGLNAQGIERGAFWIGGRVIDMGTLPGLTSSVALALNNRNRAAGLAYDDDTARAAFWNGTAIQALGELPDTSYSAALDLNEADEVVGLSVSEADVFQAVVWKNGVPSPLAVPGTVINSLVSTINNTGLRGGIVEYQDEETAGALWVDGHFFDLRDLIPASLGWTELEPRGSNDRGQLVGEGLQNGQRRGFVLVVRRR